MTKEQAKQFSEIMTDWLLRAVTIQFKNEDDEYQQMADYFNSRIIIDEKKLDDEWFNTADSYGEYCYECGIKDGELLGYQKPVEGYTSFESYLEGEK